MICPKCGKESNRKKEIPCRSCYMKDYRKNNQDKIKPVAQKKYLRRREHFLNQSKEWIRNHKEELREPRRKRYYEDKERNLIRVKTNHHFGHLKKDKGCEICGSRERLEFHHEEPYRFDVFRILCQNCHREIEGKLLVRSDKCVFSEDGE